MKIISITLLLLIIQGAIAQKKLIDNDSYKKWKSLRNYGISADGKYVWYTYGSLEGGDTLVLVSSDGMTRKEFPDARGALFTADGRYLLFNVPTKGIGLLDLRGDMQVIDGGKDFTIPVKGNGRWLAYRKDKALLLKDLHNRSERRYEGVNGCWFNEDGSVLILRKSDGLSSISLPGEKEQDFYHGKIPMRITFDKSGKQIAFVAEEKGEQVLRYYRMGMDSANILVTRHSAGIGGGLIINGIMPVEFGLDGKRVFFYLNSQGRELIKKEDLKSDVITDGVIVWSYLDKYLQSNQLEDPSRVRKEQFMSVVSVNGGNIFQLEDSTIEVLPGYSDWSTSNLHNQYVLARNVTNAGEAHWDSTQAVKCFLISLRDGSRQQFLPVKGNTSGVVISPTERFITWCDKSSCYSYNIMTGHTVDLAAQIPYRLDIEGMHTTSALFSIGGWLSSDSYLLLYDRYDIWQVDPLGKKRTINITNRYGRDNKIVLRLAQATDLSAKEGDSLLLTGLDDRTGDNGFFKVRLSTTGLPSKCKTGHYMYYFPYVFPCPPPRKASAAEVYVLQHQSADMAPNLVLTNDFRTFKTLSDISPQKAYNWMTAERVWWKGPDGKQRAGILYKPEDFDEKKKYPVIFHYYEMRSNELHQFRTPQLSTDFLNIPWYVSHGYVIFIPDIQVMPGSPGQSALISVESAADYLISTYPWVNRDKLGLQSHSFGGYETNFIITHSTRFAAAQSAAGVSDLIGCYTDVSFGGESLAPYCEKGQMSLGASLWERPDIYLENSPLLRADKVTTPLLLMHNQNDLAVPFKQSLGFFNALRRLKRKVWLLQYEKGGHALYPGTPDALDFTIRMEQFFDHYLKGVPPPVWMTKEIPLINKGIISGLRLDSSVSGASQ